MKVYAALCFVAGSMVAVFFVLIPLRQTTPVSATGIDSSVIITALCITLAALLAASFGLLLTLGLRLRKRDYHNANWLCDGLLVATVGCVLADLSLYGMSPDLIVLGCVLTFAIALDTYLDPALSVERSLARKMPGQKGRDHMHSLLHASRRKGYIDLNFFNLFWIFVIASVIGLGVETLFHFALYHDYQDRAGLLWGPFSPIYGFGAILMTIALNRLHDKNVVVIFLVSAVVGGAFEYFVSWYLQFCFGVVAWNYTGMWLSIGGRTCGLFMGFWGLLGVVWIKVLLPLMEKAIRLIPWNWRYTVTAVCAALLIFDGAMTLITMDCWYLREAGQPIDTPIERYCADVFDDQFMQNRFQTMTMNPDTAMRVKG